MVRLQADLGDITIADVDVVVTDANNQLAAGAGICGAIFSAAGSGLAAPYASQASCPTGEARITPGFDLTARWIVHAVHRSGKGEEEDALPASADRSSPQCTWLSLAKRATTEVSLSLDPR